MNYLKEYLGPLMVGASIVVAFILIFLLIVSDAWLLYESSLSEKTLSEFDDVSVFLEHYQAEYIVWAMKEQVQHHEWNLRSTKFLFWLSTLVSISGIVFAFWQFAKADDFERKASHTDEVSVKNAVAEFSFKSRSIASFILLISIIYLFVYVMFLYPIQNLPERPRFEVSTDTATKESAVPISSERRNQDDQAKQQ